VQRFEAIPGEGAVATVDGKRLAVGNAKLLARERIDLDGLDGSAEKLAGEGRTTVLVALDGRAVGVIAIADAVRESSKQAVASLRSLGVRAVMLTGDSRATAERVAAEIGIDEVIAEVHPAEKAGRVSELQRQGRTVAMVGDGVNDAPALAQADVGLAIGTGTDVAVETADVVLMRSDPLDVATAITISRGTRRKMHQNLGWAVGYNSLALPIAGGVLEPWGFTLGPALGALGMSGFEHHRCDQRRHARGPAPPAPRLIGDGHRAADQPATSRMARTCSARRRTSSSPSTALRRPNCSANSSPMYRAASLIENGSISSRSSLVVTGPLTVTNEYGGRWSSTQRLAHPFRSNARPLSVLAPVMNTRSSPSSTNQTGTTCGRPSRPVVASLPVRVSADRNSLASASVMSGMGTSY